MATVGEARLVISASDKSAAAFASVEERIKRLQKDVGGIAKAIDSVDDIARSVAPVSERMNAAAEQVRRVTAATRELVVEQNRLGEAGQRLAAFKGVEASLAKAEASLAQLRQTHRGLWQDVAGAAAPTKELQSKYNRVDAALSRATAEFEAQKAVVSAARASFEEIAGPLNSAAEAEARLAAEVERTNRALMEQGRAAARSTEQLSSAVAREEQIQRRRAGLAHQFTNEVLPFAGPLMLEGVKSAAEQASDVEQLRFRVRELSRHDPTEAPFADDLTDDVAKKYPALTRAKALDTYLELRANAASEDPNAPIDQAKARSNLMTAARAQTAALASGFEMTPVDMQNLLKSVEGSGRAGDPKAVEKISDAYIRAKQVFGTAITSSMVRDYVANAKSSNFSIGDDQFYLSNMVRMSEGNASRLGNEVNQTMTSLAGGAMKAQAGKWMVEHGLATADQIEKMGGGNVRVKGGLKDAATLQTDQATWAATTLRQAIEKSGALSDANVQARMDMLRSQELKRNPKAEIDDKFLRERAEEGLIAADLAKTGLRTTVTDNLAHFIGNQRLIERDIGQLQRASGIEAADRLGENPVAAFKELTDALSNFASVLAGPAISAVGPLLDKLAHGIASFSATIEGLEKAHPDLAKAVSGGLLAGGAGLGGYLSWKLLSGFGSAFMGGGALTGSATALGGAATALDGAAAALDGAAVRLGAGGAAGTAAAAGGGAAAAEGAAAGGAAAGGGGWLSWLTGGALGGAVTLGGGMLALMYALKGGVRIEESLHTPEYNERDNIRASMVQKRADLDDYIAGREAAGLPADQERTQRGVLDTAIKNFDVSLSPDSKAEVVVQIKLDEGSLIKMFAEATARASGNLSVDVGRSSAGVAPSGGIGMR
jgi:uncharacterized protein YoxC